MKKSIYNRSITEAKLCDLFNDTYGKQKIERFKKLEEEFAELKEAFEEHNSKPTPKTLEHLKDEFSDVRAVLTQLSGLYDLYQQESIDMAIDKAYGRKKDPKYKRK